MKHMIDKPSPQSLGPFFRTAYAVDNLERCCNVYSLPRQTSFLIYKLEGCLVCVPAGMQILNMCITHLNPSTFPYRGSTANLLMLLMITVPWVINLLFLAQEFSFWIIFRGKQQRNILACKSNEDLIVLCFWSTFCASK